MIGSHYSKSNQQNRDLQKASGMKLFQKFGTAAPIHPEIKRHSLNTESKEIADFERNKNSVSLVIVVLLIIAPMVYYIMKWVDKLPF